MSTKTTTMTMDASAEDRQRFQGIEDNNRGGSRSTTVLVDWQRQRSVDFPFFRVTNSNTVLSLSSRYIVEIFFCQIPFLVCCMKYYQYCNHAENICLPNVH